MSGPRESPRGPLPLCQNEPGTAVRGAGQGFCYNFGRAAGALFPVMIGVLSESIGLGAAIALGAGAYGISLLALLALPETRGKELAAD